MTITLVVIAGVLALLAYVIIQTLRETPEHMRLDTERVNREYYENKKPRRF